jgi:hypothetical protein
VLPPLAEAGDGHGHGHGHRHHHHHHHDHPHDIEMGMDAGPVAPEIEEPTFKTMTLYSEKTIKPPPTLFCPSKVPRVIRDQSTCQTPCYMPACATC